jgi:isoquinoline 1-oxidoreductase alpha subunit
MITLDVNGKRYEVDVPPDVPLLWVLREHLRLTGTKRSQPLRDFQKITR